MKRDGPLLPAAVFLDTNILDALPESLQSGELSNLVEIARVHIPDIVAREWFVHRFEKAKSSLKDAAKSEEHLRQYKPDWVILNRPRGQEIYRNVQRVCVRRLRDAKLRILRPPRLNKRELAIRSTLRIPPFSEGGRGFKDELVLLSAAELIQRFSYKSVILVSKDVDFSDVSSDPRFRAANVDLYVVKSLVECHKLIERGLSSAVREEAERRSLAATNFVQANWAHIQQQLEQRTRAEGLSTWSFQELESADFPPYSNRVIRLIDITAKKISGVTVGATNPQTARTLLTISVQCDVKVELEQTSYLGFANRITTTGNSSYSPPTVQRTERSINKELSIEATGIEAADGKWTDIKLLDDGEFYAFLTSLDRM